MYQYPYGDSQQLNLDWILAKIKELEAGEAGQVDLEEVANALISATYNASTQYRRYDYCFYNGKLYRCLTDTTGAFKPADWTQVVIGDDIPVLTRLINAVDASLTSLINTFTSFSNNINWYTFSSSETITSQVDNLPSDSGTFFGRIIYDAATGLPEAVSGVICAYCYGHNYKRIYYLPISTADVAYMIEKKNGTWQTWIKLPGKTEADAMQNSISTAQGDITTLQGNMTTVQGNITTLQGNITTLQGNINSINTALTPQQITLTPEDATVTINNVRAFQIGKIVIVSLSLINSASISSSTNLVSGFPHPAALTWAVMTGTGNTTFPVYLTAGGYLRPSGSMPTGDWVLLAVYTID